MDENMTVKELRFLAKEYGINGYWSMRKDELREAILNLQQEEENRKIREEEERKNEEIFEEKKRDQREYSYRQQRHPNIRCLDEPFSYVKEYALKATPIPGDEISREEYYADFTDFQKLIDHYFWVKEGENDGQPWKCLVKIDDGVSGGTYAYFEAGCDYTGFDCEGWMKVWVSQSYQTLVKFAMNEATYQQYFQDTSPVEVHWCCQNCEFYGFPCLNCEKDINNGNLQGYYCGNRYCKNG